MSPAIARDTRRTERHAFRIEGVVQGVGFRPFVYRLAETYGLVGWVRNDPNGVDVEVQGPTGALDEFARDIAEKAPPLAWVREVRSRVIPLAEDTSFEILPSASAESRTTLISPDVAICSECLRELFDPSDRRYRYPFINCTNCGPRYTIIEDIPYDRRNTTMRVFPMCEDCRREYEDPSNRRFHAQPNACPACGPEVELWDAKGALVHRRDAAIAAAINALVAGELVAVKGLGGFHLAADATNEAAVRRLRVRKHREQKALAIMSRDLRAIQQYAMVRPDEEALLVASQKPIVLLEKRQPNPIAYSVAPKSRYFGVMLPYTPLHHLLLESKFLALVMTSGNLSEEPITIDNEEAVRRLDGVADCFLVHNRRICVRSDDSVVRLRGHSTAFFRRARGYVPVPIPLASAGPDVLALGGELKNTICLTKGPNAFLSQHIGDLKNLEALRFFEEAVEHLQRILEITPVVVAHDLHPDYLSTRHAHSMTNVTQCAVQHHHAHVVSCMAEHQLEGVVIGVAFDGTGYGTDNNIWGCEWFLAAPASFRRAGHLRYVCLPGGDGAIRKPTRTAFAFAFDAFDGVPDHMRELLSCSEQEALILASMIRQRINSPLVSSLGRLFDAVSALLRVCERNTYEGQAAIELEAIADRREKDAYPFDIAREGETWIVDHRNIIRAVVEDIRRNVSAPQVAARFHNSVVAFAFDVCERLREETGLSDVVLSGGCFQNEYLTVRLCARLEKAGFRAHCHRQVPANDGGLSLGQAVIAQARLRNGEQEASRCV